MKVFSALILAFALTLASVSDTYAQSTALGDFNGDGYSDLYLATVSKKTNTTTWKVFDSSGAQQSPPAFPATADAVVPGKYAPGARHSLAIIHIRDKSLPLEWHIDGVTDTPRYYGMPGDTPVQADYDCDGVTDLAVRRRVGNSSLWYIKLSKSGGSLDGFTFGGASDRVFGADADGDGCAELFALSIIGDDINWSYRKIAPDTVTNVRWGKYGDIPLKPFDINDDKIPDLIAVHTDGGLNYAQIRYSSGSIANPFSLGTDSTMVGNPNGIPFTGNFVGSPYLGSGIGNNDFSFFYPPTGEMYIRLQSGSYGFLNFGSDNDILARPDGSSVFPRQNERFYGQDDAEPDPKSGGRVVRCKKYTNISSSILRGFVHNPANSRGKMKVILPSSFNWSTTNEMWVTYNKKILEVLPWHGQWEGGPRKRWYSEKSPKSYPKNMVWVWETYDGQQYCVKIPNPRSRYDNR